MRGLQEEEVTTVCLKQEGKISSSTAFVKCDQCDSTYSYRPYAGYSAETNMRRMLESLERAGWDVTPTYDGACLCPEHKAGQDA